MASEGEACADCGGALAPGTGLPPCLCTLITRETLPALAIPEVAGGAGSHARALRCPGCGGWLDQGARRCGYCTIELAAVRCWRCFELAFAGSASCAACGAKLGLEGHLGPTEHRCPACTGEPLHRVVVGDHRIEECLACGGVLVDQATLEALTRVTELEAGARLARDAPAAVTTLEVRYRGCPTCGALMNRLNFGQRSGVIIDVCKLHGVWFDADELTRVLAFVAGGGLVRQRERDREEGRRALAQRRIEALAQQGPHGLVGGKTDARDTFAVDSAAALLSAILELFR
jgi:Zn-finger nucleic acid-binding protein